MTDIPADADSTEPYDRDGIVERFSLLRAGGLKFAIYAVTDPISDDISEQLHYTSGDTICGIFPMGALALLGDLVDTGALRGKPGDIQKFAISGRYFRLSMLVSDRQRSDGSPVIRLILYLHDVPIATVGPAELELVVRLMRSHRSLNQVLESAQTLSEADE